MTRDPGRRYRQKSSFWSDGLSVRETKFSVLIICFVAIFGLSLYMFVTVGDIPENQLELTKTIIYAIAGINIAHGIKRMSGIEDDDGDDRR